MAIDLDAVLHSPVFATWGVAAELTLGSVTHDLTVLDKTRGEEVMTDRGIYDVLPVIEFRAAELTAAGLTADTIRGASIVVDGTTWTIRNAHPLPGPTGSAQGRVRGILEEV